MTERAGRTPRQSFPDASLFPLRRAFALRLFALLAHRAALELELDVAQLDDVVVDQVVLLDLLVVDEAAVRAVEVRDLVLAAIVADGGVLARDLLVGEDDVAVGRGAGRSCPRAGGSPRPCAGR